MTDHVLLMQLSIEGFIWWKQEAARARSDGSARAADRMENTAAALFEDARRYAGDERVERLMLNYIQRMSGHAEHDRNAWFPIERAA